MAEWVKQAETKKCLVMLKEYLNQEILGLRLVGHAEFEFNKGRVAGIEACITILEEVGLEES